MNLKKKLKIPIFSTLFVYSYYFLPYACIVLNQMTPVPGELSLVSAFGFLTVELVVFIVFPLFRHISSSM